MHLTMLIAHPYFSLVNINSFADQVTLSKKVKSDLQVHLDTSIRITLGQPLISHCAAGKMLLPKCTKAFPHHQKIFLFDYLTRTKMAKVSSDG